jgi:hypothetical protein
MSVTLEQALDKLDHVIKGWATMIEDPTIRPVLTKKQREWTLYLEEVWPPEIINKSSSSHSLDTRVNWVVNELSKWAGVRRTAWDTWVFDDKKAGEKFLTLYHLIWTK